MAEYLTPPHTPESRNLLLEDIRIPISSGVKVKEIVARMNSLEKRTSLGDVGSGDQGLRMIIKKEAQNIRGDNEAVSFSSNRNGPTFSSVHSTSSPSSPDRSSICKVSPSSSLSSISSSTSASYTRQENSPTVPSESRSRSNFKSTTPKPSYLQSQRQSSVKISPRHSTQSTYTSPGYSPLSPSPSVDAVPIKVSSKVNEVWKTWNEAKSKRTETRITSFKKKLEIMEKDVEMVRAEAEHLRFEAEMVVLGVDVLLFECLVRRRGMGTTE